MRIDRLIALPVLAFASQLDAASPASVSADPAHPGAVITNQILGANLANWYDITQVGIGASLTGGGVTVNSISPGVILTEGVEGWFRKLAEQSGWGTEWPAIEKRAIEALAPNHVGRAGRPDDVVHAVLYLASPKGGFVTGTDMLVSGGPA